MAAHTKLWYLERFRMLDVVPAQQRQVVEKMTRMLEVKRGQRIYIHGDPSDQVFLLKAGVVKIARLGPRQQETILAFLYPGDVFGELAFVDQSPRDHVAEAHEDTVLCALSRDLVIRIAQEAPALGYHITKVMGQRVKRLETRLSELLGKGAAARVAHTLVELAETYGVPDAAGVLVPLRLSQSDIGNLVGLTRETVNIVLQDFRQRGLVLAERRAIRIADMAGLRAVS